MTQYIPLEPLLAEIERRIKAIPRGETDKRLKAVYGNEAFVLMNLLSFIDTLEVKEVDLEKEINEHWDDWAKGDGFHSVDFAKHFFELGLKARHDNWKVVDNINPPQTDRNKIYCVFTKGRYILAKVIYHPQDDDLLQWKCTEFPFHCYDMCERDKYMQIV